MRRTARFGLTLLLLTTFTAPVWADEPPLHDLPLPDLERFEPDVREQLTQLHADTVGSHDAATYGALGEAYLAYELPLEADAALAAASRLGPEEPRWTYLRALAALETGDREAAARHFDETLARRPAISRRCCARHRTSSTWAASTTPTAASNGRPSEQTGRRHGCRACAQRCISPAGGWRRSGPAQDAAAEFRRALEFQPGADGTYYHLARRWCDWANGTPRGRPCRSGATPCPTSATRGWRR